MSQASPVNAEAPVELPPSRVVRIPGRGEFFLRDSGGDGTPVLLLHGYFASADTNWFGVYEPLARAGYRVLAIDHRGHGRGLRSSSPFRLVDCADDTAAVIEALGCGPVIVLGYSMGGAIAQLLARRHPETLLGMVLSGTARDFGHPVARPLLPGLNLLPLAMGLFPSLLWRVGLTVVGLGDHPAREWMGAELSRSDPLDLVEAGQELMRYDSRPWIGSVEVPAAVIVHTTDLVVPPRTQRELATSLRAQVCRVDGDHFIPITRPDAYVKVLLEALSDVLDVRVGEWVAAA